MIGTPTALSVRVSRRLGDGKYGSLEVSAELTVNLGADAKLDDTFDAIDAWLTAKVGKSAHEKLDRTEQAVALEIEPLAAGFVPGTVVSGPATDSDPRYEVIEVKNFAVEMTKSGKRIGKAFGGRWMKYGITFWPETAAEVGVELDACDLDRKYNLPAGLTKGRVEMDGDKPRKIVRFEK